MKNVAAKDNSGKPDALKGARPVWGWGRAVMHALHHIQLLNLLFRRPKLLILDETMELLPPEQRSRVWPIIQDQSGNGMATLWATESLDDAVSYSTRLTAFHEQGILFTDATRGLDHLSLVRLCYGRRMRDADATLEQFHQTLCYTEAALRDLPTAVIVVDNDLSTRFVNSRAAALFNASEAGMLNKKLADFGRADSVQLAGIVQDAIFEAEDTGGDVEWRSRPHVANSENKMADVKVRRIVDGANTVGFLVVIEDVSEREELQRQLVLSENMASIGLLAAGVAHEVNNPLAIIDNYNRFLKKKVVGDGLVEAVQQIEAQSKRIQQIVHNLVAISSGRLESRIQVDIHAMAGEICALLREDARGRDLVFTCRGPEEKLLVMADPNEMRLVILNLLRNSMEAMENAGGEICVEVSRHVQDGHYARLSVRDNGPGICFADPNNVFIPLVSTKKTKASNQGIGLSIVHKIIGKYRGTIAVENMAAGGCQFVIRLPCLPRNGEECG